MCSGATDHIVQSLLAEYFQTFYDCGHLWDLFSVLTPTEQTLLLNPFANEDCDTIKSSRTSRVVNLGLGLFSQLVVPKLHKLTSQAVKKVQSLLITQSAGRYL